ncbi:MAG TPA: AI-2E family transporter [Thermomicrobiales bacterium]|jgi:predicted PurR-regulated permease PerM
MDPLESPLIVPPATETGPEPALHVPRTRLDLPWPTVAKAIVVLIAASIVLHLIGILTPVLLEFLIALLLTAALTPPVTWLIRRGIPRVAAVAIVMGGIGALIALGIGLITPTLVDEGRALASGLPDYVDRAQRFLRHYPPLETRLRSVASSGSANPGSLLPYVLTAGTGVFTGITDTITVIVMAAYLLAGGERSLAYLMHYLPPTFQARARRAVPDIVHVVSGYMLGQAITSLLFGVFAFVVLTIAGVPQPLLLALLAAILDAVPIIGVLVATALPVLLALTVSTTTAVVVLVLYLVYHQIESHVLVPRIYGRTLGISSLAVLVAVLVGYRVLGILGVLIALPLAAAIPAIERAWRQEDLLVGLPIHRAGENNDRA